LWPKEKWTVRDDRVVKYPREGPGGNHRATSGMSTSRIAEKTSAILGHKPEKSVSITRGTADLRKFPNRPVLLG